MTSHTAEAIVLYSASVEDLDTVVCFLDLHDTREFPKKMQYPVVDLHVSGHPASQNLRKP